MDPAWETRFQEAVRQAVLSLKSPASLTDLTTQHAQQPSLLTLSVTTLAEAEATHVAHGHRLREARESQKARAKEAAKREAEETARKEAELAWKAAKESKRLHEQLQAQLQQLAATDAAAALAFADRRA
jgi:hypothetical protein